MSEQRGRTAPADLARDAPARARAGCACAPPRSRRAVPPLPPRSPRGAAAGPGSRAGRAALRPRRGTAAGRPAPLVLMLHGAGGDARAGWASPSTGPTPPACSSSRPRSRPPRGTSSSAATARTWPTSTAPWRRSSRRYAVDPSRVAVGGFSDGASYALSLGLTNGDLFTHVLAFSPGFRRRERRAGPRGSTSATGCATPCCPSTPAAGASCRASGAPATTTLRRVRRPAHRAARDRRGGAHVVPRPARLAAGAGEVLGPGWPRAPGAWRPVAAWYGGCTEARRTVRCEGRPPMDATREDAATDSRDLKNAPTTDAAASDVAPADETTGTGRGMTGPHPPTRPERGAPVEAGRARPGEALGEPLSEDPVTHELRAAGAAGPGGGRAARPRRSTMPTLQEARQARGWSPEELAGRSGVEADVIAGLETGQRQQVTPDAAQAVAADAGAGRQHGLRAPAEPGPERDRGDGLRRGRGDGRRGARVARRPRRRTPAGLST